MNINRHNYEEYFLLYVDNELSAAQRRLVELFVKSNPDLEEELNMLQQTVLRPEKKMMFENKEQLLKNHIPSPGINESNYEEYFILYGDDELTNEEKIQVEEFVYKHPQYESEFELIQQAHFMPDAFTVFPDKQLLYRHEEPAERVIVFRWWRMAAAAAILFLVAGIGWYTFLNKPQPGTEPIVSTQGGNEKNTPANSSDTPSANKENAATPNKEDAAAKESSEAEQKNQATIKLQQQKSTSSDLVSHKSTKKAETTSNFSEESTVTPKEAIAKLDKKNEDEAMFETAKAINESKAIDLTEPKKIVDVAVGSEPEKSDAPFVYASAGDDRVEILNTSVSKKNSMRGFFRKVSRVVGKATGFGPEENNNSKGIRIANFEIALK